MDFYDSLTLDGQQTCIVCNKCMQRKISQRSSGFHQLTGNEEKGAQSCLVNAERILETERVGAVDVEKMRERQTGNDVDELPARSARGMRARGPPNGVCESF